MWTPLRSSLGTPTCFSLKLAAIVNLLWLTSCTMGLSHPEPPTGTATVEKLERYVQQAIADGDPPSISIHVSFGDTNVYDRAFGHADGPRGVKATPETTYRWFSVTKPFTAAAVLQLAERGTVSLAEPAATYLPFLNDAYGSNASYITIDRLLSHRAGIGDVGDEILSWVHLTKHRNQSELLKERLPDHVHFEPEELDKGHYSNLGYMILGAVVEAVSGESYESYVTRNILSPLGMHRTHFHYEDPFPPGTAHAVGSHPNDFMAFVASFTLDLDSLGREKTDGRWWFRYFSPDQTPPSGLISTSSDMARFGRMVVNGGVLDGQRVLTSASVTRMTTPRVPLASSPVGALPGFALGDSWFVTQDETGRRVLMHGGQGMAYTSLLLIRPADGVVATIASNGTYVDGSKCLAIMDVVARVDWSKSGAP